MTNLRRMYFCRIPIRKNTPQKKLRSQRELFILIIVNKVFWSNVARRKEDQKRIQIWIYISVSFVSLFYWFQYCWTVFVKCFLSLGIWLMGWYQLTLGTMARKASPQFEMSILVLLCVVKPTVYGTLSLKEPISSSYITILNVAWYDIRELEKEHEMKSMKVTDAEGQRTRLLN